MLKLILLVLLILGFFSQVKPEKCFTENKSCKLDSYNLIEVLTDIPNISECKEICEDNSECQYFTYHDDEMSPTHYQKCYLFRLCNTMNDFPKAYTGFTGLCTCSLAVEPQDGHLVKELYAETEIECQLACQENTDCELFTFYEPDADCELLQGVTSFGKSPLQGYNTGPKQCKSENGICTFSLLDNNSHAMLLESKDSVLLRSGMFDCSVNVSMVLVGKGGDHYSYGGGGSGYVNNTVTTFYPTSSLNVLFNQDGSVTISANGVVLLEAMAGGKGAYEKGGDGYSGGDWGYGINGGMDGMDGGNANCSECGKGQGIDIQQLSSPHFMLTPGPGGNSSSINGGGGVLANGLGPEDHTSFGMGAGQNDGHGQQNGFAIFEIVQ